jgi:hypothetical protein
MIEEEHRDDLRMAREVTDQVPSYIVINGVKEWLSNYGFLAEVIMWEEEEVDTATTNNSPMANEETSCPSTDPVTVPADRFHNHKSVKQIRNLENRLNTTVGGDTFSRDNLANVMG